MKSLQQIMKRMGFQRDQDGIMNRYLREKPHWDNHLEKTRRFINNSFTDSSIESIAVLGSGWLLDVPLSALVQRFRQIYLVDIFHPPQIRHKVKGMINVELLEADLSGGAVEQIWNITREKSRANVVQITDKIRLIPPLEHIHPDALISVNLLNQLDIILCDYLRKQGYFQQESADRFRSHIQAFHLDWITRSPGCLITDTHEIGFAHSGKEKSKSLLYTDLPAGHRSEDWTWEFDTLGTYTPGTRIHMRVRAVEWA